MSQAEVWLEIESDDTVAAAKKLRGSGRGSLRRD